jgi:hypothetical protein
MQKLGYIVLIFAGIGLMAGPVAIMAQQTAPETVILKGAPMGGVRFDHAAHQEKAGQKCETCHHPSKPERALTSEQQRCQDCHTTKAEAPMTTKAQAAFHDPMFKKGTCPDCHITEAAAGKLAPLKCNECHKKENV